MGAVSAVDKLHFKLFLKYFTHTGIILTCQNVTKMSTKFSSSRFLGANVLALTVMKCDDLVVLF